MEKQEFEKLLMDANFTKKEFAKLFGISHQTVVNWGNGKNIPYWVESWLHNYIELKEAKEHNNNVFSSEEVRKLKVFLSTLK